MDHHEKKVIGVLYMPKRFACYQPTRRFERETMSTSGVGVNEGQFTFIMATSSYVNLEAHVHAWYIHMNSILSCLL